ncbi:MAG: hypothetical protein ACR2FG_00640 [Marmoricola sp.]
MFIDYYAKANDDYRRETLTRSWTRPAQGSHRRLLPHLPSVFRHGRAA